MAAGDSAAFEAESQRLRAIEFQRLADLATEMHRRYSAGAIGERQLARTLECLGSEGYTILADRKWPGSRRAQVDFVAIGPGGVFIVDAKHWSEVVIAGGLVMRGEADATDDFDKLAGLAESTRNSLADLGLAPGEVHAFAVFTNSPRLKSYEMSGVTLLTERSVVTSICRRGRRLEPWQVNAIVLAVDELFPAYEARSPDLDLSIVAPVLPAHVDATVLAEVETAPELTEADILDALVEGIEAQPIEAWMSFLHPLQAQLVRRSFSGPSRIRGAAGTGKTVVGLHRAAHLARTTQKPVLVTTFVSTLPAVMRTLMRRMAPDVAHLIDFAGVHSFALSLLRERDVRVALDTDATDQHFNRLLNKSGLLALDAKGSYWRDELDNVIRGRGLTRFEDYATLVRVGRRRRLTAEQRNLVWDLHVAYSHALQVDGLDDFVSVIAKAETSLRDTPLDRYAAVVIDEAQDLSCSMARMLHSLVGDRQDGLNLIGDGQQSIYAGGFTLSEAGISISGRGVVMGTNYRNTAEIVDFAAALVAGTSSPTWREALAPPTPPPPSCATAPRPRSRTSTAQTITIGSWFDSFGREPPTWSGSAI